MHVRKGKFFRSGGFRKCLPRNEPFGERAEETAQKCDEGIPKRNMSASCCGESTPRKVDIGWWRKYFLVGLEDEF
jgi:hypothetical protein